MYARCFQSRLDIDGIQAYWQTSFDNVKVNGKSVLRKSAVIIDSGTSIILGPTGAVQTFYGNIPGSEAIGGGSWTCTFSRSSLSER